MCVGGGGGGGGVQHSWVLSQFLIFWRFFLLLFLVHQHNTGFRKELFKNSELCFVAFFSSSFANLKITVIPAGIAPTIATAIGTAGIRAATAPQPIRPEAI